MPQFATQLKIIATLDEGFDVLHRTNAARPLYLPVTKGRIESSPMYGLRVTLPTPRVLSAASA